MNFKAIAIALMLSVTLIGCANKQQGGMLTGAALGGLLGSQFGSGKGQLIGVALGVLGGAWLGSEIGKSLDKADAAYANRNAKHTLENTQTGRTTAWRNPDSGHSGTFTPTKTYLESGEYCREYQTTVTVGGKTEQAYGKACRQPDGQWKITN